MSGLSPVEGETDLLDRSTNESTQVEKFAIDSVQGGLEEISFSRIFAVEELQELLTCMH